MNNDIQAKIWEQEYRNPLLLSKDSKPQACTLRFLKFLKKQGFAFANCAILDLGCGTGRNANYLAAKGARACGLDISASAIKLAQAQARALGLDSEYRRASIGNPYPFADESFDIVLDITASNSLNSRERENYLKESARVLKQAGYFFVRALSLEGDSNAKKLLQKFPGPESGTYIMPHIGLREKVFARAEITDLYQKYFKIVKLAKASGYTRICKQSYKRNFWIMYLQKK